jgi:leucyl aminopeptidase
MTKMEIQTTEKLNTNQNVLTIGIFEEDKEYQSNEDFNKELKKALEEERFSTKKFGATFSRNNILAISLGKKEEFTTEKIRQAMGKSVQFTKSKKFTSFSTDIALKAEEAGLQKELIGRATAEGIILSNYEFKKYVTKDEENKEKVLETVSIACSSEVGKGIKTGEIIAQSSNFTRDMINEPSRFATPTYLEEQAKKIAKLNNVTLTVLNREDMKKEGMGAILGVSAGSDEPPKLLILEYKGSNDKPTAIVGKGITFDTGGYNLKPSGYMFSMKSDMSGAAAVLGTIKAMAELGVKKHIIGVAACSENSVSGSAIKPSDILIAYNKKSIEVGNTDAEGRLVLADALSYTDEKYKPEVMIDLATLTGACVVALGEQTAALMTKDDDLAKDLESAGLDSYDRVWRLPLLEEYEDSMKGSITDLSNIAPKGHGAGSITAGVFLSKFVKDARWAHLDIAGPAFLSKGQRSYLSKNASGSGVRILSYYFLN